MSKTKTIFHRFKMSVPDGHGFKIISYSDILWLQSVHCYTEIILCNNQKSCFIYESLTKLEGILPPIFFKCHRSAIINLCHVKAYDVQGIHINNHILPVSQRNKIKIRDMLEKRDKLTFPLCKNCDNCPELGECTIIRPFISLTYSK